MVVRSGASDTSGGTPSRHSSPGEAASSRDTEAPGARRRSRVRGKKHSTGRPRWKSASSHAILASPTEPWEAATTGDGVPSHPTGNGLAAGPGGRPLSRPDAAVGGRATRVRRSARSALDDARRVPDRRDRRPARRRVGRAADSSTWITAGWPSGLPRAAPFASLTGWARAGCAPLAPFDPEAGLPWITARLNDGTPLCLTSPDELPPAAAAATGPSSSGGDPVARGLPLVVGGTTMGWLVFGTVREARSWPPR